MVKVREDHPVGLDGSIDLQSWMSGFRHAIPEKSHETIIAACEMARQAESRHSTVSSWYDDCSTLKIGLEMAAILAELKLDTPSFISAILYRAVRENKLSLEVVEIHFGSEVAGLISGVLGMAVISTVHNPTKGQVLGQQQDQLEKVRKMLISIIDDVRVALIKLAERTCAIRALKGSDRERQLRVAREVFEVYAPLAHRLGIGYIKWELEDLAFRYLRPQNYKKIANLLDEKRLDRERYIQNTIKMLREALATAGINGEVCGRVKHIYSIWRKMHKKGLEFKDLYDIRALRILVDEVKDCYAALGVVHGVWSHIPKEFDDYIATPKLNGYQSLHTAVIGPEGQTLEVQIRSKKMHEEAELGVCAHWLYKGTDTKKSGDSYEEKINWLRQVLEWQEEIGQSSQASIDQWRMEVEPDRVYVFTRNGHVVDLPVGATSIDFAYRIHTEIGHRCRGAKVGGRIVPLTYKLKTGDQVEILTATNATPSRDWLNAEQGYVATHRARSKIVSWFRRQNRDFNIETGRTFIESELKRQEHTDVDLKDLLQPLGYKTLEDFYAACGTRDLRMSQILGAIKRRLPEEENSKPLKLQSSQKYPAKHDSDIQIDGITNIMTQMAGCCHPLPGDSITGFITAGRGVTIHRVDCDNIAHLKIQEPERIVTVQWQRSEDFSYPVKVSITACDRQGLIRDITTVLANNKINVVDIDVKTTKNSDLVTILMTIETSDLKRFEQIKSKLSQLEAIMEIKRQ